MVEKKCNIYCRVPRKRSRAASAQNTPWWVFWKDFLSKARLGRGIPRVWGQFMHNSLIDWWWGTRQEYWVGSYFWVGCHFLLHQIFPTQWSNPGILHCRHIISVTNGLKSTEKVPKSDKIIGFSWDCSAYFFMWKFSESWWNTTYLESCAMLHAFGRSER